MIDFFLKIILFIYLFWLWWALLLHGLFSSCREWGLFFTAVCGFLIAVASPIAEHGL